MLVVSPKSALDSGSPSSLKRWVIGLFATFPLMVLGAATPTPTPAPLGETAKWIASADAQWRSEYEHVVAKPYEKGITEVRKQYLAAVDAGMAQATRSKKAEETATWRDEITRITADITAIPADDSNLPFALKAVRRKFRPQVALLLKDHTERARALLARCDDAIAKKIALLPPDKHAEEIAALQAERDQLHKDWSPGSESASDATSQPPAPPVANVNPSGKLTPRQILQRLLALGAQVTIKTEIGQPMQVQADTHVDAEQFTFVRVGFRSERTDRTPLTTEDYDILDYLPDVQDLTLAGPSVKDSVMEKLRVCHALRGLTLDRARPSATGYAVLSALPALRQLGVYDTGANAAAMAEVMRCRQLQSLALSALEIEDDGLADVGKLTALESLQLSGLNKLTSKGFIHIADCRLLKSVSLSGFIVLSGMVENISHCKNLEYVSMPNSLLKDPDVLSLNALPKLRTLDLAKSHVTGAVFAQWHTHKELTTLNLDDSGGVNDEVCKSIEKVFPKLQTLYVNTAVSGFSSAGAACVGRLHELRTLKIAGPGMDDEDVDQLAHAASLTSLSIPLARVGDTGAAAISRLVRLTDLSLDTPPITDAAMKSFGRCKLLRTVNIGRDAEPDTETKFSATIPGVVVRRSEG